MALYTLIVVALYPAFKTSTSLDNLVKNDTTAAALFGVTGRISTSAGWLNANIYANFLPLIMLLLTVGYGAACIAGQDEDGTLCLLATLPARRSNIALQKATSMAVQATALAAVAAVCVLAGRSFQLSVTVGDVIATSAAAILLGLDFGIITMAVGALTGRRGTAIGVGDDARCRLLSHQLARPGRRLDPTRPVRVAVLLVGRQQPDHQRGQRLRLGGPGRGRHRCPLRGSGRLQPTRPSLALLAPRTPGDLTSEPGRTVPTTADTRRDHQRAGELAAPTT